MSTQTMTQKRADRLLVGKTIKKVTIMRFDAGEMATRTPAHHLVQILLSDNAVLSFDVRESDEGGFYAVEMSRHQVEKKSTGT